MRKGRIPDRGTVFLGMGGDGATTDIGFQALSGAFERGHDFVYVCYDNEAYMNTGIQRSSSTPFGASTTTSPAGKKIAGQVTWKKNMAEIAVAHNIPYVATACSSYPFDLIQKVQKAAKTPGPAYVHILSVCPTGWRLPPNKAIWIGRLAVETGVFPLYEVVNGRYRITQEVGRAAAGGGVPAPPGTVPAPDARPDRAHPEAGDQRLRQAGGQDKDERLARRAACRRGFPEESDL